MRVIQAQNRPNRLATKAVTAQAPMGMLKPTSKVKRDIELLRSLAESAKRHPWTFATVDAVARSVVGAGWKFVPVERYKSEATKRTRKRVESFFEFDDREWDNIKDFANLPNKIAQTVASYRLFGQASWELVVDGDELVGFDVLPGILVPNVDENGFFESPAFTFHPWDGSSEVEYESDEVAYFFNPGITGHILGESPYEPLTNTSLPSDLFAAVSYRSLFENVNAPYNGIWNVDPNVTDEDFDMFLELLQARYSGAENYGRNPLVVRGMADFKSLTSRSEEDAPYLAGRAWNREEFFGVTGVDGNKLGITSESNKANIRETRREFHESLMRPLFGALEDDIYYQVIVRSLGIRGWKLSFNKPDITTALEQASIDMRYLQWGVYSPNEIRAQKGDDPRENGDEYYAPMNTRGTGDSNNPTGGNNPATGDQIGQDRTENDDTGSEPASRPPRDESTTSSKAAVLRELKNWRKKHLEFLDGKRPDGGFEPEHIPANIYEACSALIDDAGEDFTLVKNIFAATAEIIEGMDENE